MPAETTFSEIIMRCPACSAPMYRVEDAAEFCCPSCGKRIPVNATYKEMFVPDVHTAPTLKGNEIHFLESLTPQKSIRPSRESIKRAFDLRKSQLLHIFQEKAGKSPVIFTCPHCRGLLSSRLDQPVAVRCKDCRSSYSLEEVLCFGQPSLRLTAEENASYPTRCLPFTVPRSEAIQIARDICQKHRGENAILKNDRLIDDLVPLPFFVPYLRADLRIVAKCRTGFTSGLYFLDLVNWPLAANHDLDIFLLDHIARWDFDDLIDFDPRDVKKANILPKRSIFSTDDLVRLMLRERVDTAFQKAYNVPLRHLGVSTWDLRFPRKELIALPIYYAQLPARRSDALIRIAINATNGLSAMVIRRGIHFQTFDYDSRNIHPFGEATMNSIPLPVHELSANESYAFYGDNPEELMSSLSRRIHANGLSVDMTSEPWKKVL